MEKVNFFIIPGFKMCASDKPFLWLHDFLRSKGFNVIDVPVDWNYKVLSKNAEEFTHFYKKHKGEKNYILGFSYGAVIAFMTAQQLGADKLFLCSMSPIFKDDAEWNKKWLYYIGKRRYADSLTISDEDYAKKLKVETVVFYGEKEAAKYPALLKRNQRVADISKSKLVVVKEGVHQIDFPAYQETIKREVSTI